MTRVAFLVLAALLAAPAAAVDLFTPRVFDIVPPDGATVQMVDDLTVLRQKGQRFGAVITFMPESGVAAWVPLAVLNTSGGPLEVGTGGVTARYGETPLKVWQTTGLIREARERRDEMLRTKPGTGASTMRDRIREGNAGTALSSVGRRSSSSTRSSGAHYGDSDEQEAARLADAQFEVFRDRLFADRTLEDRGVARGDVRIELPPRRDDGQPTEFVLTLAFGGERMDVRYRERDPKVQVGEPAPAAGVE